MSYNDIVHRCYSNIQIVTNFDTVFVELRCIKCNVSFHYFKSTVLVTHTLINKTIVI